MRIILPPKCIHHAPAFRVRRGQQHAHLSHRPHGCSSLCFLRSCGDVFWIRCCVVWLGKDYHSCHTTHRCCQPHQHAHRNIRQHCTSSCNCWRQLPATPLQVRVSCGVQLHVHCRTLQTASSHFASAEQCATRHWNPALWIVGVLNIFTSEWHLPPLYAPTRA